MGLSTASDAGTDNNHRARDSAGREPGLSRKNRPLSVSEFREMKEFCRLEINSVQSCWDDKQPEL